MSLKTISKGVAAMITVTLLLFAGTAVYAQQAQSVSAPRTLSYQGVLTSTGTPGNILGANRLLTVTLYGDANGTIKLWQSTMNTPIDSNGVFNCMLGTADNPLPQPSVMDRAIWLGVAVDNGTELRPLSQVTASAYAINVADHSISTDKVIDSAITSQKIASGAIQSANLADASVTSTKLADSSITSEKMNMNYVSSISVNGQPITGAGTNLNIVAGDGLSATWVPDESTLTLSGTGGGEELTPLALPGFDGLTTGTNTTATMTVGTGASLLPGGTGTVTANVFSGVLPVANGGTGSATTSTWNLIGNTGTIGNFIGTTNSIPLVEKTNNITALQLLPTTASSPIPGIPNIIGGFGDAGGNAMATSPATIQGSIIAGGGGSATEGLLPNTFVAQDDASAISGGEGNLITFNTADGDNAAEHNNGHVIAGGIRNTIISEIIGSEQTNIPAPGAGGTIGGGQGNLLCGPFWGTIAGGQNNLIATANPTVDDDFAAQLQMDFIGGGNSNTIGGLLGAPNAPNLFGSFGVIAGGQSNHIGGGTVSGGVPGPHGTTKRGDVLPFGTVVNPADFSAIGGGQSNSISTDHGTIGGGSGNTVNNSFATIGGGESNIASGIASTVGGGVGNTASLDDAYVGGGSSNTAGNVQTTVAGGISNTASGTGSTIGGGTGNTATADATTVSGGRSNNATSTRATVAGGLQNNATGNASSIGGGWQNTVSNFHFGFGNIPGGLALASNGDAETVLGWMNFYQPGTLPTNNNYDMWANGVVGNPARDARILEVGSPFFSNGNWVNFNAFEVSYNGHSIVYHTNGSSLGTGLPPVYQGATYVESPVYAWGEFNPSGNTVVSDFGVSQIVTISPGVFMVSICPADPHDPTKVIDLSKASITVTVVNNDLSDITTAPQTPPGAPPQSPMEQQISNSLSADSVRHLLGVPDSVPDPNYSIPAQSTPNNSQQPNEEQAQCTPPEGGTCGYATASDFTVLNAKFPGAGLQFSFIVRTYQGGSTGCQPTCLPFFFKVCHR